MVPKPKGEIFTVVESVNIKPFYMIKSSKLLDVLAYIQKADEQKISFTKNELYATFPNVEIEAVVSVLLEKGILSGFQGSTKELVVDDYDAFFKIVNNPRDYTME